MNMYRVNNMHNVYTQTKDNTFTHAAWATWLQSKEFLEPVRSAKCLLAAVAHVKEAVLVLVRVINTSHQASCGKKLHHHLSIQLNPFLLMRNV